MEGLTETIEVLKYTIPSLVCVIGLFALTRMYLKMEEKKAEQQMRIQAFSTALPLRLAAYERAILFLERIEPSNLVPRINPNHKSAKAFEEELVASILEEYEHNIVQQLYISDEGWMALNTAKNDTIATIRASCERLGNRATGLELAASIYLSFKQKTDLPIAAAIRELKRDMMRSFT